MINLTVGPVQMDKSICQIGAEQIPYFRTVEFSELMKENEILIKNFAKTDDEARVVFITGSGTAAMEATVMNIFTEKDKVLIVNGGSFGARFVQLCKIHDIPYTEIKLNLGEVLTEDILNQYGDSGYTGFLVNVHETSTGIYYNIDIISKFCKKNNIFLVVDAISSFLADPFDMKDLNVGVMIAASQKAIACPPGVSIIVLSAEAIDRINKILVKSMYFNLKDALKNGERGQTPFTPAIGIIRQINERLKQIARSGGVDKEILRIKSIALDFRQRIRELPLKIVSQSMSNAMTPISPLNVSAYDVFLKLKDEYNIWICPNGGELADKIFRVGHIGSVTIDDNIKLIDAFKELQIRGLL